MSIKTELPEELLRGRVGFNSTGLDSDEQSRNGPRQTATDIARRQTKKRLDDYLEQQALKRELESFWAMTLNSLTSLFGWCNFT